MEKLNKLIPCCPKCQIAIVPQTIDDLERCLNCGSEFGGGNLERMEIERLRGRLSLTSILLNEAHAVVCSHECPSVWKTGEDRPHTFLCETISRLMHG